MSARHDVGPVLPPRSLVHQQAVELRALATLAAELSGTGPTADLSRAVAQMERMRAILGPGN